MNFEYAFTLFLYFLQCVEHGAIFIALLYVIFTPLFPELKNQATFIGIKQFGKYYLLVHLYCLFVYILYRIQII